MFSSSEAASLRHEGENAMTMHDFEDLFRRREGSTGTFDLAADETRRFRAVGGDLVLHADCGEILVTQEGDPEDHVLTEGGEWSTRGSGLVVAWALKPSRLEVHRSAYHVETAALAGCRAA